MTALEFSELRYGLFVHFGAFSAIGRGEWVMNRERISPPEYEKLAKEFNPVDFNADEICSLAAAGNMKYIVFTTMHHEGFRMYESKLSSYNAFEFCKRDFVREIVDAARKHGLKIGLYHSLNNWHDAPDAVDALEDPAAYQKFIDNTFARLKELVELFNPIDILWYDGWWPFNSEKWQAQKMNEMVKSIQPWLLVNGRNGLPGDFGTPEQHLTAPTPWRPFEGCVTLNKHWGYHQSDNRYKTPEDIVEMLLECGNNRGNLLLNIGPDGTGKIPAQQKDIILKVGEWLRNGGEEAIAACDKLEMHPMMDHENDRLDWDAHGKITASGKRLFYTLLYPIEKLTFCGMQGKVLNISVKDAGLLPFTQQGDLVSVAIPEEVRKRFCPVLVFECDSAPGIYRSGGLRVPECEHPRYDPVQPDIQY